MCYNSWNHQITNIFLHIKHGFYLKQTNVLQCWLNLAGFYLLWKENNLWHKQLVYWPLEWKTQNVQFKELQNRVRLVINWKPRWDVPVGAQIFHPSQTLFSALFFSNPHTSNRAGTTPQPRRRQRQERYEAMGLPFGAVYMSHFIPGRVSSRTSFIPVPCVAFELITG